MIFFVLPAFDEEKNLEVLFNQINQIMTSNSLLYQIVIVNDGSNDKTQEIIEKCRKKYPLRVIRHPVNEGLGKTLKDGLKEALKLADKEDYLVTMDSDNTHSPSFVPPMLAILNKGKEVVIAGRYKKGAEINGCPLVRKILSRVINLFLKVFIPLDNVSDYTSGFRVYRAAVLKKAFSLWGDNFIDEKGFVSQLEILNKLQKIGVNFAEIPFILNYGDRQSKSKLKLIPVVFSYLRFFSKIKKSPAFFGRTKG